MKILIDIPEKIDEYIKDYIPIGAGDNVFCYPDEIVRMIQNGTPIPDNATNGDVIKAIFPNSDIEEHRTYMKIVEGDYLLPCAYQWWNAPYQKGGK